jgi:hypothetical protein
MIAANLKFSVRQHNYVFAGRAVCDFDPFFPVFGFQKARRLVGDGLSKCRSRSSQGCQIKDSEFEKSDDYHHLRQMSETVEGAFDPEDFSFVVKMRGGAEKPWICKVHCAGKGKPVKRSSVFYKSAAEATREGKKALARILKAESASVVATSTAA